MKKCLNCGMTLKNKAEVCPKCDAIITKQRYAGAYWFSDLGHKGFNVLEAVDALDKEYFIVNDKRSEFWRIVVGHGVINKAVKKKLDAYKYHGMIKSWEYENPGSFWVQL